MWVLCDANVMHLWASVKLPEAMAHQIDQLVDSGYLGYTSRAEFVRCAVRDAIEHAIEVAQENDTGAMLR